MNHPVKECIQKIGLTHRAFAVQYDISWERSHSCLYGYTDFFPRRRAGFFLLFRWDIKMGAGARGFTISNIFIKLFMIQWIPDSWYPIPTVYSDTCLVTKVAQVFLVALSAGKAGIKLSSSVMQKLKKVLPEIADNLKRQPVGMTGNEFNRGPRIRRCRQYRLN